ATPSMPTSLGVRTLAPTAPRCTSRVRMPPRQAGRAPARTPNVILPARARGTTASTTSTACRCGHGSLRTVSKAPWQVFRHEDRTLFPLGAAGVRFTPSDGGNTARRIDRTGNGFDGIAGNLRGDDTGRRNLVLHALGLRREGRHHPG